MAPARQAAIWVLLGVAGSTLAGAALVLLLTGPEGAPPVGAALPTSTATLAPSRMLVPAATSPTVPPPAAEAPTQGAAASSGPAATPTPTEGPVPAAPSRLVARLEGAAVSLSWSQVEGIRYYNIYRGDAPAGPYEGLSSSASPAYTDASAVPGSTYFYVVTAVTAGGVQSRESNEAAVTVAFDPESHSTPAPATRVNGSATPAATTTAEPSPTAGPPP